MTAEPVRTILLFGANGQVGQELQLVLPALGRVVALDRANADLAHPERLRETVRVYRPGLIVNAAAYTAVDRAEKEQALARTVNAEAPAVLAEEARSLGAAIVHFSTDYVFDGSKPSPYVETDATGPLQAYGRTKLAGEQAVQSTCERHLVLRTSWVYAAHGHNFVRTMLRLATERDSLRIVDDQVGAPTAARLIAQVTVDVLRALDAGSPGAAWGLYHLVASGETSWHGFARHVIAQGRTAGLPLRTAPEAVVPITTAEYPVPAARPANSRLDTGKLRHAFGVSLPDWTEGVNEVIATLARPSRTDSPT